MKYQPPYGVSDPTAPYINGNPALGQEGSIPPAAAFEQPMREIVGVIEKSGFVPSDADLLQLTRAVRSQRINYALDTGTSRMLTAAFDPPFSPVTNPYTPGLTLHVRVRETNAGAGQVTIDAGAGRVPIRKMNNADVGDGELPVNSIATLVFDGQAFQLSNFGGGGAGGAENYFTVNIPFAVDQSAVAGTIRAIFNPVLPQAPAAGDIIAVQVMNTTPGPTSMLIDGYPNPVPCMPNGGGEVLQGDIAAGDIVQFFFDGTSLRFAPNPEMNAPVTYTVGPGQQYTTVDAAMAALKRKSIGANGFVDLVIAPTGVLPIVGPINVSHPSGDRIRIRGTRTGAIPTIGEFERNGNSAAQRAQDAIFNLNLMRTRYLTEIKIPGGGAVFGVGIQNSGPGMVRFDDLLIVGDQLPMAPGSTSWMQEGLRINAGFSASCTNVAVWGAQVGFNSNGAFYGFGCLANWNSHAGIHEAGAGMWLTQCSAFGNGNYGIVTTFGSQWQINCTAQMNGGWGMGADSGSGGAIWWSTSLGNGTDLVANVASSITFLNNGGAGGFATSSPAPEVVGNNNSIIVRWNAGPQP